MEQYAYRALSYELFCRVLEEPEFRDWPDVGIVVQAYHGDAENELRMLREWVERRGTPITIRLVKGAYWDYEVATARRLGWPEPVFLEKWQSDASFERCARFLIEHHEQLRPAFGSHNVRSLAHAIAAAEARGLPKSAYELQTLFGMGDVIQRALVDRGHRVRVYTPYGAILPGMAYLVRRLLENTSNESFLKASFAPTAQIEDLLRDPEETGAMLTRTRRLKTQPAPSADGQPKLRPFHNEPPTDFARAENREAMRQALDEVRSQLGRRYPLLIGGKEIDTGSRVLDSVNPSQSSRVVGQASLASVDQALRGGCRGPIGFPGLGGNARGRPGRHFDQSGGDHAEPALRAGRMGDLRMWQALGRGRWRRRRGDRLLRVLRPRDDPPGRAAASRRLRRDQLSPSTFPAAWPWSFPPGIFRWRSRPA